MIDQYGGFCFSDVADFLSLRWSADGFIFVVTGKNSEGSVYSYDEAKA